MSKTECEKITQREVNSTIIMVITMGLSSVIGFQESNSPPPLKGSSIYTGCVYLDKTVECSALFNSLTAYLRDG